MQSWLVLALLFACLIGALIVRVVLMPRRLFPDLPLGGGNLLLAGAVVIGFLFAYARSRYRFNRDLARWEQKARGCCIHCGYDLRATPKRCPECGNWVDDV